MLTMKIPIGSLVTHINYGEDYIGLVTEYFNSGDGQITYARVEWYSVDNESPHPQNGGYQPKNLRLYS